MMIAKLARKLEISKVKAAVIYDTFVETIKETLMDGTVIDFRSLMKLEVVEQQPRNLLHPINKTPMQTQPFKVLRIRTSQIFRKELNSK